MRNSALRDATTHSRTVKKEMFDIFKRDKGNVDCDSIKESVDLYPKNSISVIMVQTDSGKSATGFGFIMDMYIDNAEFASKKLSEMHEDPNKLVEFGCGFNKDPKWKEYNRITKLTK